MGWERKLFCVSGRSAAPLAQAEGTLVCIREALFVWAMSFTHESCSLKWSCTFTRHLVIGRGCHWSIYVTEDWPLMCVHKKPVTHTNGASHVQVLTAHANGAMHACLHLPAHLHRPAPNRLWPSARPCSKDWCRWSICVNEDWPLCHGIWKALFEYPFWSALMFYAAKKLRVF